MLITEKNNNKNQEKMEKNFQGNWDNLAKPKRQHHYGYKIDKMNKGDYSFGICFSIDSWLGEFYLYMNIVKWTLCIGRFAVLDNVEEDE